MTAADHGLHVLIVHEVESYPAWKAAFDRAAGLRKAAGELRYALLRHEADVKAPEFLYLERIEAGDL